jgi:GNAT superfamily N-acetyltransferase
MRVRAALAGEEAALSELALRSKAHWGYDAAFLEACRQELRVTPEQVAGGQVCVAEDGRTVGMSVVDLDAAALVALFVEPAAIGTGVGRALLTAARERAASAGLATLELESDPHAEAFYLAHGARRVGEVTSPSTGRRLPLLELPTSR